MFSRIKRALGPGPGTAFGQWMRRSRPETPHEILANPPSHQGEVLTDQGDPSRQTPQEPTVPEPRSEVPREPENEAIQSAAPEHSTPTQKGDKTDGVRHEDTPPSSLATREPDPAELDALDPILRPAYRNSKATPIFQLPEELLLKIMLHVVEDDTSAAGADLVCLRWASRTFLRLFASPELSRFHSRQRCYDVPERQPWPSMEVRSEMMIARSRREVGERLDWDMYCGPCLEVWRAWETRSEKHSALASSELHCAPCRSTHPAIYFSSDQRKIEDDERRCIAYEGHIRLCAHRTADWSDVVGWLDVVDRAFVQRADALIPLCREHPTHPKSCANGHLRDDAEDGVLYAKVTNSPYIGAEVTIGLNSHVDIVPTPTGEAFDGGEKGGRPLPNDPGRRTPAMRYAAENLREALRGLYDEVGKYLIPEQPPPGAPSDAADLLPHRMSALGPNVCGCVRYPGLSKIPITPPDRPTWPPPPHNQKRKTCRPNARIGFNITHTAARSPPILVPRGGADRDLSSKFELRRCWMYGCGSGARVSHEFSFSIREKEDLEGRKVPDAWYTAVDPASYGLAGDAAGLNFLWCDEARCRNYHKRVKYGRFQRALRGPPRKEEKPKV